MLNLAPVPALSDNYVWILHDGQHAAVADPGEARPVLDFLAREKLKLAAILLTHHHADHIGGVPGLLAHTRVPVFAPYDDRIPDATRHVREGDRFALPELGASFDVLEVPAHTRTHIAYYGADMVLCGDTLFACGCGRLFEGTPAQMHAALSRLAALPPDTRVCCGHEYTLANIKFARAVEPGNTELAAFEKRCRAQRERGEPTVPTTIAQERATNPFIRVDAPDVIRSASGRAERPLAAPADVLGALREWKNNF